MNGYFVSVTAIRKLGALLNDVEEMLFPNHKKLLVSSNYSQKKNSLKTTGI